MLILSLFYLLFYIKKTASKLFTPYVENIYLLTYCDKNWNLEAYILEKMLPLKIYGIDFRFSGNNGKIVWKALKIQGIERCL